MADVDGIYNGVTFELGTREFAGLAANFHRADEQLVDAIRDEARDMSERVRALTRRYAPKLTHFMEEHVRVFMSPSGLVWEVGWDATDFVEAGFAFYPWYQEFGTRHMDAQPSLGPASAELFPIYRENIATLIRASITRLERGSTRRTRR